jgi:CheY-like chemotaxis protein
LTSSLRGDICFTAHFSTQQIKGGGVARSILIADDSLTVQRIAQKILREEGFEVETVSNGVAAVKKLPALQPVLVLADVSMPGKDGYEVCEFVKTSADLLHVPVLLVGSDLEPYDEQRGQQVRADGIIKKPFTAQDLIDMVAKFTGPGEAPASRSTLPDTLIDEVPATPPECLPEIPLEPMPEPATPDLPQSLPEPQLVVPPEDVVGAPPELLSAPAESLPEFAVGLPPEPAPEPIPDTALEPALTGSESSQEVEGSKSREVEELSSRGVEESIPQDVDELTATPQLLDSSTSEPLDSPTSELLDSSTSQLLGSSTPGAAAGAPSVIAPAWVYVVVHKVVAKMAPPALPAEQVEEIVRRLTQEITSELGVAPPQLN